MAAAENAALGMGICPCCDSPKAVFKLSGKGLAYVTCNGCNFQGFARSGTSDEKLRARIGQTTEPAPAPAPAPAPVPVPAPAPAPAPKAKNIFWIG